MKPKIKIYIIDDHVLLSESLTMLLEATGLFEIIGFAGTGKAALQALGSKVSAPDIVLIDYYLPDTYGTELIHPIISILPDCHIIVLTADPDPAISKNSFNKGAEAVITKNAPKEKLIHTIMRIAGSRVIRPVFPAYCASQTEKTKSAEEVSPRLIIDYFTRREFEVIRLISKGKTSREIAQHLFISFKTVENHRNNILQKSGAKNMIELINYMIKQKHF